jgi:hypothetical protein
MGRELMYVLQKGCLFTFASSSMFALLYSLVTVHLTNKAYLTHKNTALSISFNENIH